MEKIKEYRSSRFGVGARFIISAIVVGLAIWAVVVMVMGPMRQNLLVGSAIRANDVGSSPSRQRSLVGEIDRVQLWDPYLEGFGKAEAARVKLKLGRQEEALRDFREALERRVPTEVWVETGLLELVMGERSEAERHLGRAIRFFPDWLFRVPRGPLRNSVDPEKL